MLEGPDDLVGDRTRHAAAGAAVLDDHRDGKHRQVGVTGPDESDEPCVVETGERFVLLIDELVTTNVPRPFIGVTDTLAEAMIEVVEDYIAGAF